jgi:selenocysteine lyase/cysteine desulfurase
VTELVKGYDVAAVRAAEFPWADETLFLNHASIGPIPERSRRALERYQRDRAAAHRLTEDHLNGVLHRSRSLVARLIGADPTEIALATNTSYGLNLAARMLPLAPGDRVLVSRGEFPANVFPWRALGELGIELELVPTNHHGWPDEATLLERIQDPEVRVLALSMVQFHTGYLADLAALAEACRASDTYFVVDAIQGIGQVPIDLREIQVDVLACGAQKWLLSPWGSGFVYDRRDLIPQVTPPFAGWTAFEGTDDYRRLTSYDGDWLPDARKFELITLPFQDFLGMNEALELFLELGVDSIRAHLIEIGAPIYHWAERRSVRVTSPVGRHQSGIVAVAPPDVDLVFDRLTAAGVVASLREGSIRLSPHCYNTIDEMARVADLLDRSL